MTDKKTLASHLKDDYKIEAGGKVIPKTGIKVKIQDKEVEFKDQDIWVLAHTSKGDRSLIVNCTKVITHARVIALKQEYDIKFVNYDWKKEPNNIDLWGYLLVTTENGTVGDGEVHIDTLARNMRQFAYTILKKRAEDRAILQELGLYSYGIYSDAEITPEMRGNFDDTPEPKSIKEGLLEKIKKAHQYLGQTDKELLELVAGLTGEKPSKIDLDSMSPDILAKISNTLNQLSREEMALRKKYAADFLRIATDTKKTVEELLEVPSFKLKEGIEIERKRDEK
jgi:hypothetical protein